jgi:hypothetical protein
VVPDPDSAGSSNEDAQKTQVNEFWDDLIASFHGQRSYFLGTVVLSNDGEQGRKLVIDGQQRIATTSILLAAVRDELRGRGAVEDADSIENEYVGAYDRRARARRARLILNSDDRDYYDGAILNGNESSPTNSSQTLIARAFEFLSAKIQGFAEEAGTAWREKLDELVNYLDADVQVVAIDVATQADAFLIFETLNDRGADLTVADLLKNYLFSQAEARLDEVRDSWIRTLTNLDLDRVGNQRFTTFARHLMSSKDGRTRERELYARIRRSVTGPQQAVTFAQELKDASRLYYALITIDSDYWSDYSEATRQAASVLVELKVEQCRPLLLAALSEFSKPEVERFLPTMVSWLIRGLASGNLGAGSAETAFCEAARAIRQGKVATTEAVLQVKRLSDLIPTDATFETDFAIWRVTRGALARYLLRALEMKQRGEAEPELVVNSNPDQVNLEHILPQSAKDADWPQFSPEERRLWVNRIGNMCLLQKGPNGRIGNKPWVLKAPVLGASDLQLTSRLGSIADWTKEEIAMSQSYLARLALDTWPRLPR